MYLTNYFVFAALLEALRSLCVLSAFLLRSCMLRICCPLCVPDVLAGHLESWQESRFVSGNHESGYEILRQGRKSRFLAGNPESCLGIMNCVIKGLFTRPYVVSQIPGSE